MGTLAGMSSEVAPVKRKLPWLKIAVVAVALLIVAAVLLRGTNPRELMERGHKLVDQGMAVVRDAGPWAFFTAYALLPAMGVPMLTFALPAGPVFGEKLGMGTVVLLAELAMIVNMAVTYALARRALRPLLEKLMTRLGYKLPEVASDNVNDLLLLLRLTPGIPFFVQNYLLGLAGMPFGRYMVISIIVAAPQNAAFVYFGDALVNGKGMKVLLAGLLIAALTVATRIARKHYAKKKIAATVTA